MTKQEAEAIRSRIIDYWAKRGCTVSGWIEKEPYIEGVNEAGYTVRTDLVNGLPRKRPANLVTELERRMNV